jgi:hypothetical protein
LVVKVSVQVSLGSGEEFLQAMVRALDLALVLVTLQWAEVSYQVKAPVLDSEPGVGAWAQLSKVIRPLVIALALPSTELEQPAMYQTAWDLALVVYHLVQGSE